VGGWVVNNLLVINLTHIRVVTLSILLTCRMVNAIVTNI
jgi:hypothetical protein